MRPWPDGSSGLRISLKTLCWTFYGAAGRARIRFSFCMVRGLFLTGVEAGLVWVALKKLSWLMSTVWLSRD